MALANLNDTINTVTFGLQFLKLVNFRNIHQYSDETQYCKKQKYGFFQFVIFIMTGTGCCKAL